MKAQKHHSSSQESESNDIPKPNKVEESSDFENYLPAILGIFVIALLLLNAYFLFDISGLVKVKKAEFAEASRPAKLQVFAIEPDSCTECSKLTTAMALFKGSSFNATILTYAASEVEAKNLIAKYQLVKLPAIVVTGEIEKNADLMKQWSKFGLHRDDALVMTNVAAPYYDLEAKQVLGLVTAFYINTTSCKNCDRSGFINDVKLGAQVGIKDVVMLDSESSQAKKLIADNSINALPALIFSSELKDYPQIAGLWKNYGIISADGSYILNPVAPYYDLSQKRIRGEVSLVYLTDKSCSTCYNVSVHMGILNRFGMKIENVTSVDISDAKGKELISTYNIKQVPTFILGGDVLPYTSLTGVWPTVGSVEFGLYIFRNVSALQGFTYKDLSTGQVVVTAAP